MPVAAAEFAIGNRMALAVRSMRMASSFLVVTAREMKVLRHRVFAAVTQWLTAQQPPAGQQATAPRSETGDRNPGIIGAGRVEAAMRAQERAEPALVQSKQPKYQSGKNIHVAGTAHGV